MTLALNISHRFAELSFDIQFDAPPGVTARFGRSGSGKTSVVNMVAGLLRPNNGRIVLNDTVLFDLENRVDLPPHKRRLGYVFQDARLFPHMSVHANLAYGTRFAGNREGPTLDDVVSLLDIQAILERSPKSLSGGERQRVAIGRALLARPRMLLLDEPLAALDQARKSDILPYLERLRDEMQIPMLYVSHSLAEVARLATTVVLLDGGRVVQVGPTGQILSDPNLVRPLGVRDAGAVMNAHVERHHTDGLSELTVSGGQLFLPGTTLAPGTRTRVRILAQDVILSTQEPQGLSALNILRAVVSEIRPGDGPGVICRLKCADDYILARVTRRSAQTLHPGPGQPAVAHIHAAYSDPAEGGPVCPSVGTFNP